MLSAWVKLLKTGSLEDIIEKLRHKNKRKFLNDTDEDTGQHSLFYAVSSSKILRGNKLLDYFLSHGADPNLRDHLQQTALFYAAKLGHKQQVSLLLEYSADVNTKDTHGQTPLYYAAKEGRTKISEILLQSVDDIDSTDYLGQTAMFYACREGQLEVTKTLLQHNADSNHMDKTGNTPLFWARRSGNKELVATLERAGAREAPAKRKRKRDFEHRKSEKKLKCQLMKVDAQGDKKPVTVEEFREFEANFPEIAKFFLNSETLCELDYVNQETLDSLRPWEKPAKRLIKALWRNENSWVFHEPVDPVKLSIADYFDFVKKPMDFGTVKKKLYNNAYKAGDEFVKDLDLVFNNCRLYNRPGSQVIKMCDAVQKLYEKQLKELGMDVYQHTSL